jgi:methionyl aminopeptidase
MSINDERDIEWLKRVGAAVAAARDAMGAHVAPGVTTAEFYAIGKEILHRYGRPGSHMDSSGTFDSRGCYR